MLVALPSKTGEEVVFEEQRPQSQYLRRLARPHDVVLEVLRLSSRVVTLGSESLLIDPREPPMPGQECSLNMKGVSEL